MRWFRAVAIPVLMSSCVTTSERLATLSEAYGSMTQDVCETAAAFDYTIHTFGATQTDALAAAVARALCGTLQDRQYLASQYTLDNTAEVDELYRYTSAVSKAAKELGREIRVQQDNREEYAQLRSSIPLYTQRLLTAFETMQDSTGMLRLVPKTR